MSNLIHTKKFLDVKVNVFFNPHHMTHLNFIRPTKTMSTQQSQKKHNLWDALSITFIVQRWFCLFPLKRQGNHFVHSFWITAYSIATAFCYFSFLLFTMYLIRTEHSSQTVQSIRPSDETFSKSYLILVIATFELIFNNLGILIMISFAQFKKDEHMLFLHKVYDVDLVIMDELKMDINYHRLRIVCYVAYFTICIYYSPLISYVLYKLNDFQYLTPGVSILAVMYLSQQIATAIITWNYTLYVMMIHHRFAFLRKRQEDLVKEKKMLRKNGVGYTENIPIFSTILMTYKELCSCIDVLNKLSGSILILRIAHDFTLTTSQIYLISWIIMDNNGDDKIELVSAICFWVLPNIVKMILTTLLTEITIDEAKSCSYTINKSNKNSDDEDVQCMLDSFDLWLLHRKIEFNANNFFKIDLNLLYAVIGSLTSYVLILIQFKQQEETFTTDMNSTTMSN